MNPNVVRLAQREIAGPIVIGRVRPGVARGFGAAENWVWLSFDTLLKQRLRHPELTIDFYEDLEWLFFTGLVIADRHFGCLNIVSPLNTDGGNLYKATLKIVQTQQRLMLLSVYRTRQRDYNRVIRQSKK